MFQPPPYIEFPNLVMNIHNDGYKCAFQQLLDPLGLVEQTGVSTKERPNMAKKKTKKKNGCS